MNLLRIIKFAAVLLLLRSVFFAVTGSPPATDEEVTAQIILLFLLKTYVPDALVVIAVLARLTRIQARLPYAHAAAVVVLHELMGAGLLAAVGWTAQSSPFWLLDYLVVVMAAGVGALVGVKMRVAKQGARGDQEPYAK